MKHRLIFGCLAAAFAVVTAGALADDDDHHVVTKTPIKHLVVIFQENISFDHYFGTYPNAANTDGTPFHASPRTPKSINNLVTPLDTTNHFVPLAGVDLLNHNPNAVATNPVAPNDGRKNGLGASNPFRLSRAQALTADQGHNDSPEQSAYNNGNMDGFPAWVGSGSPVFPPSPPPPAVSTTGLVMGYFDGNTATALWNYAQHFAMNDNSYVTQFGPSSPGAIDLVAGQTNGFAASQGIVSMGALLHVTHEVFDGNGNFTLIGDADPLGDTCSTAPDQVTLAGRNIGDLLNARGITWGWFEGGFDLTITNPNGTKGCARETNPTAPGTPEFTSTDYIPHHQPFQYYASTRNPSHNRPSSVAAIGHSFIPHTNTPEPANHQYDTHDFFAALAAHNLPAVTFLKAPAFQDGHAGYSDPLDEQNFLVAVINALQKTEEWESTAVVIAYDDSDGWYDHQMPPIVNPSRIGPVPTIGGPVTVDTLNGPGHCDHGFQQGSPTPAAPLNGNAGLPANGRCAYGTRSPLLVISPFAKVNFVDHTLTDQSSVLRFIEDNWLAGERIQPGGSFDTIAGTIEHMFDFDHHQEGEARRVFLDPMTGAVVRVVGERDDD